MDWKVKGFLPFSNIKNCAGDFHRIQRYCSGVNVMEQVPVTGPRAGLPPGIDNTLPS
jgi:hypothetical protein